MRGSVWGGKEKLNVGRDQSFSPRAGIEGEEMKQLRYWQSVQHQPFILALFPLIVDFI